MNHPNALYEPKLLKRWIDRYRDFEAEEACRKLKELRLAKDLFRKDLREHPTAA